MRRGWAFATAGLAAGFSGLAVVGYILGLGALWVLELVLLALAAGLLVAVVRRTPRATSAEVWRVGRAGLIAGIVAVLLYDASRTVLSVFDPSPYNPFEAVRRFGMGIVGADATPELLLLSGLAIHVTNGASFGGIYALFVGRRAATFRAALFGGLVWGVTLEIIQSIFYPGWLQITTTLREFLVISGLGHVVYGLTLGAVVHAILRRQAISAARAERNDDRA